MYEVIKQCLILLEVESIRDPLSLSILAEILVMGQIQDADLEFEKKLSKVKNFMYIYIYDIEKIAISFQSL